MIILKWKKRNKKNNLLLTAVCKNGEICGKFTFIFRKKFYLSRKNSVTKFATSASRETLCLTLKDDRGKNKMTTERKNNYICQIMSRLNYVNNIWK